MNINKILISGRLYDEFKVVIKKFNNKDKQFRFKDENELTEKDFFWADAYVGFKPSEKFTFGNLKWIHSLGAGVDKFIYMKDWKKEVLLTRTIGSFGKQISQYCLSYILRDAQYHQFFINNKSKKIWNQKTPKLIDELNILILGTGHIGCTLAEHFKCFGIEPIGVSLSGNSKKCFKQVFKPNDLCRLLSNIDWIICTLPLTDATYKILNYDVLKYAANVNLINVGRGKVIDEEGLIKALNNRNVNQAVLDVFDNEPISDKSLLWKQERIIITPHIAAVTRVEDGVKCFLDTLNRIENNQLLKNVVDVSKQY